MALAEMLHGGCWMMSRRQLKVMLGGGEGF